VFESGLITELQIGIKTIYTVTIRSSEGEE
jgi:hypothetical protein